jgi:hypothetical protein
MAVPQQVAAGVPQPERASPQLPPGLWVVVPAFNEARALGGVLDELATLVPNIVVVDDGSTDETSRVALDGPSGSSATGSILDRALPCRRAWSSPSLGAPVTS